MATRSWSLSAQRGKDDRPPICQQIDQLQRISQEAKKELLGADWFRNVKSFYSLDSAAGVPSALVFRPNVDIPQLQMFMLAETAELTENSPVVAISNHEGKREEERERVLRGLWRTEFYNIKIMLAQLWGNLGGTGILAYGLDPFANNGRGTIWAEPVDPSQFDPDPVASGDDDWQYVVYERAMHWDEVVCRWPDKGYYVRRNPVSATPMGDSTAGMRMPFGPMQGVGTGQPAVERRSRGGNLIRVRFTHTLDPTPEKVKEAAGSSAAEGMLSANKFKLMFPNGRLTIDAPDDGVALYDGNNPTPRRKFPYIIYYGMPKLEGFWAPPPIRYTRTLQEYAERSLTQAYENAFRCNNSIFILPDGSGINADTFGGLPGEIQVANLNQGNVQVITPNAFPASYLEYIKFALQMQAELVGYSGARGGQPGAGNLSPELYEAAIEEASKLTKLRSRMAAVSTQKFAEGVFYLAATYFTREMNMPVFDPEFSMFPWKPIESEHVPGYNVWVDPGSIEVMSAKNLRKTALALNQAGKIDDETLLEVLHWPEPKETAQRAAQEAALRALTLIKRGKMTTRT